MSMDQAIADALATYVPPTEEPSQQFPPLIPRAEHKVVSTKDYRPKTGGSSVKVQGQLAVDLIQDDYALEGWRLVEVKGDEVILEKDDNLQAQANLRKDYQAYRNQWGDRAAHRQINGAPDSPMEFVRKVANGLPLFPEPDVPTPVDPAEARIRSLEATVARLEGLLPKLPR
jgi:hypothetical protein